MKRKLTKMEKGLLLGFASNILSEKAHNHIFNFVESESNLSRKYFMPPLLEVAGKLGDSKSNVPHSGKIIDEIIISDNENDSILFEPALTLSSIQAYDDDDFFNMFRLKKSSVQALEDVLVSLTSESSAFQSVVPEVPLQMKILITTMILGSQESYKRAAQIFHISVKDCEACFMSICNVLAKNINQYVTWPSPEEADMIADSMDGHFGFPGVIGVIGSASIKSSYSNQISKSGSCILQVVCDYNTLIRDAMVGPIGMDSVSGVFETSPIYKRLTSKRKPLISAFKHIIGNAQYPQLASLLTPYCGQSLTADEKQFNTMHESARKTVDKCFNVLVTRFSRLQSIVCRDVDHIKIIVLATCFLHNFLLQLGDQVECI